MQDDDKVTQLPLPGAGLIPLLADMLEHLSPAAFAEVAAWADSRLKGGAI